MWETNLMLKESVIEAVRQSQFHIWSVETVEEGIEILTGIEAGQRREDGTYDEGTVFGRVDQRLKTLSELMESSNKKKDSSAKEDRPESVEEPPEDPEPE
jgi:predicted ATP-dependent protease